MQIKNNLPPPKKTLKTTQRNKQPVDYSQKVTGVQ